MDPREVLRERLLANREIDENGCWQWTRSMNTKGYGQTSFPGLDPPRPILVHRIAAFVWMEFDLWSSLCVLHHCDNPPCFNPAHLWIGTIADNQRDMARKGRGRNRPMFGEANHWSVLTTGDVLEIRARAEACEHRRGIYSEMAREYGLTPQGIRAICIRKTWRHVP